MNALSISKLRTADQSVSMTAAQPAQQATSPEEAFALALQSNMRFSSGGTPSLGSALDQHVDMITRAQQNQPQQAAPAPLPVVQNNNAGPQNAAPDNSGNQQQAAPVNNTPVAQTDNGPAPAAQPNQVAAKAADNADSSQKKGPAAADKKVDPTQQLQPQAIMQIVQMVVQQQAVVVQQTGSQQQTGPVEQQAAGPQDALHPDHDPFAWLDKNSGANMGPAQTQANAGNAAGQDNTPVFDLGMAKAAVAQVKQAAGIKTQDPLSMVDQQAQDLSSKLAGTGANVAVKVQVTTDPQANASVAAPVMDPLMAAQAAQSSTDSQGDQANGQTNAESLQATAAISQLQNAANSADATAITEQAAFAALVKDVAPVESAETPQGPQPLAQIGGVTGTQATQKASAPQAPQSPRSVRQPLEPQVMDQLNVSINKAVKDGVDTIKVALKPAELGRIEIKLEVGNDGQVKATVTAENKDTLAMLQKDSDGLSKALSDAGLKTDPGSMSFNLRGDQSQQQNAGQNQGQGQGQGKGGRGRRVATGIDATSESSAAISAQRAALRRSGVDIQV